MLSKEVKLYERKRRVSGHTVPLRLELRTHARQELLRALVGREAFGVGVREGWRGIVGIGRHSSPKVFCCKGNERDGAAAGKESGVPTSLFIYEK